MKLNGIILLCLIILITGLLFAFQQQNSDETSEYMTIVITSNESGSNLKANISVNGEGYVREELRGKQNNAKGPFDFNPALTLLLEYQRGGWNIVSNNLVINEKSVGMEDKYFNYFFLVREKPIFKKK